MRLTNLRWPATASVFVCRTAAYGKQGRLAFVDPAINSNTGAFDARAEMPNADAALRPGQFARVILEGARRSNTIVVPQRAVMDGPQGKFVFVTGKGGQDGKTDVALPRPVSVGDWVELEGQQQWIIESGLKPGDVIVINGMAKLFPIPGGAPIMLGPPPGIEGKGGPPGMDKGGAAKNQGEVKKAEAKKRARSVEAIARHDERADRAAARPRAKRCARRRSRAAP